MNEKPTIHEQMLMKIHSYETSALNALRDAEIHHKKADAAFNAIRELRYQLEAIVPKTELKRELVNTDEKAQR